MKGVTDLSDIVRVTKSLLNERNLFDYVIISFNFVAIYS